MPDYLKIFILAVVGTKIGQSPFISIFDGKISPS